METGMVWFPSVGIRFQFTNIPGTSGYTIRKFLYTLTSFWGPEVVNRNEIEQERVRKGGDLLFVFHNLFRITV